MKRTHSNENKQKKAEIRKLVLEQLKKMRQKMKREHPGLLENMREILEKNQKEQANRQTVPTKTKADTDVDHKKNKEAVEKLLTLKSHSPGFQKAVETMLSSKE